MIRTIADIPFFINTENRERILSIKVTNYDEMYSEIKPGTYIYRVRESNDHESEYPDASDVIVGKVIFVRQNAKTKTWHARIELIDSLYYTVNCKGDPVIRINGYGEMKGDGTFIINKITRLTLSERKKYDHTQL